MSKFENVVPMAMLIFFGLIVATLIVCAPIAIYRDLTDERYYIVTVVDTCSDEEVYIIMRNIVYEKDRWASRHDTLEEAEATLCRMGRNRFKKVE